MHVCRLMSESMMPLTSQMSTLVSSGGHHRTGPQRLENDVIQVNCLSQVSIVLCFKLAYNITLQEWCCPVISDTALVRHIKLGTV